jgi:hypothetical protein
MAPAIVGENHMRVGVAGLLAVAIIGLMLTHGAPARAQSTAYWCKKAAECANKALKERFDEDNPGMGKKFNAKKKECLRYSKRCNEG